MTWPGPPGWFDAPEATVLAALLAAAGVIAGSWWQRRTAASAWLVEALEAMRLELVDVRKRMAEDVERLEIRAGMMEQRARRLDAHVSALERHINEGLPPPAPERPEGV